MCNRDGPPQPRGREYVSLREGVVGGGGGGGGMQNYIGMFS